MKFLSTGSFVPPRRMTNQDFEKIVYTSDQWIVVRTCIHARHVAEEETTLTMAMAAAKQAMEGVDPSAICLVLVATFTPDQATPSVASQLQQALGLPEEVLAYDINAGCSGFLFALLSAERLLEAMPGKCALLVGAEKVSGRLDYTDRGTCILFGDGAGAAVVQADGRPTWADYGNRSNGSAIYTDEKGLLRMEGRQVYQFAVRTVTQSIRNVLEKAGLEPGQLDHVVCHQANHRIIEAVARHLGAPMELFFENLGEYGNTSAASIPLALDEMHRNGMLKSGQRVLLEGFGSGLSWGSYLFEW